MWTLYLIIVLVNIYNIYGKEIDSEISTRARRDVRSSERTSKVFNSYQTYGNYMTTPTVPTNYNNFITSTSKYNSVRSDNNYYYNNNYRNNDATYNGTGINGYRYNHTSVTNSNYNNLPDYTGNYNYETTPTNSNKFVFSTPKYNNVRYNYNNTNNNNNYRNNDMYTPYNSTGLHKYRYDNISVTNSPYNQFPEYNGNYNYENNNLYNPFNTTGYNRYRYYNNTDSNIFPGYRINGTAVYQPAYLTIPKYNTTGFRSDNVYNIFKNNATGYDSQTTRYETPKTTDTYNYQDPNQSNFRGYFQQNTTTTPNYGATPTPASTFTTPVTPDDDSETDVGVTQIACVLCNIGCPDNHSRKGFYCVPNDFEYE